MYPFKISLKTHEDLLCDEKRISLALKAFTIDCMNLLWEADLITFQQEQEQSIHMLTQIQEIIKTMLKSWEFKFSIKDYEEWLVLNDDEKETVIIQQCTKDETIYKLYRSFSIHYKNQTDVQKIIRRKILDDMFFLIHTKNKYTQGKWPHLRPLYIDNQGLLTLRHDYDKTQVQKKLFWNNRMQKKIEKREYIKFWQISWQSYDADFVKSVFDSCTLCEKITINLENIEFSSREVLKSIFENIQHLSSLSLTMKHWELLDEEQFEIIFSNIAHIPHLCLGNIDVKMLWEIQVKILSKHIQQIPSVKFLKWNLEDCDIRMLENIFRGNWWKKVYFEDISLFNVTQIGLMKVFDWIQNVQDLKIIDCDLNTENRKYLEILWNWIAGKKILDFSHSMIEELWKEEMEAIFSNISNTTILKLCYIDLEQISEESLRVIIQAMKNIVYLDLWGCKLQNLSIEKWRILGEGVQSINTLYFRGFEIEQVNKTNYEEIYQIFKQVPQLIGGWDGRILEMQDLKNLFQIECTATYDEMTE